MSDEISKARPKTEIGATGLNYDLIGNIEEEFLPELRGDKAWKKFREMSDNDPIIGAILYAIDMMVRQVDWQVHPFDDDPANDEAAEFVDECLHDMSHTLGDFMSEVFSAMLVYGYGLHEIVYKKRDGKRSSPGLSSKYSDGKVGWRKLAPRSPTTRHKWRLDDQGGVQGFYQLAPPLYEIEYIPITKALLFRAKTIKNNPEGRSILRNAYRPYYFKKRIEEIEGIGVERDLAGLPMLYVDPELLSGNLTPQQEQFLTDLKNLVVNVRRDRQEGVILPLAFDHNGNQLYKFELLSSGGQRQFDTTGIVNRYNQQIAMSVLADFIMLGQQSQGSFALAASKTNLFAVALGTWLENVASVFNRHAIPRLLEMNGMPTDKAPRLTYRDISTPDLTELATYIVQLAGAGAELFPDENLERHLRQAAKLPPPPPKEMREQMREEKAKEDKKLAEMTQMAPQNDPNKMPDGSTRPRTGSEKNARQPTSPGARPTGPRNPKGQMSGSV